MIQSTRSLLLKLEVISPLSIGSGRERGALKEVLRAPVVTSRGVEDLPVIPASSLKGAFRGTAEMLGRSWGEQNSNDSRMKIMTLHKRSGGTVTHNSGNIKKTLEELMKELSDEERSSLNSKFQSDEEKLSYFCPICRLFGAPGIAASIRFSDALPRNVTIQRMARTMIDRKRLKVSEKRFFTDEIIAPGSEFSLVMLVDLHEGSLENKLLNMIIRFAEEVGFQLGGGKSVGRGRVRLSKIDRE